MAALSSNQRPTTSNTTRSALNRRLHACAARIAAATGQDAADVKADFVARVTRETRLAGRATTHSSELADDELRRVVYRISLAADRCGKNGGHPAELGPPPSADVPDFSGPKTRLPNGVSRLRTKDQEHVLRQLAGRLFGGDLAGDQNVVGSLLKECPDSATARAKIDELKSRLVREADLAGRAARMLATGGNLNMREKNVLHQVSAAAGRQVNALPVGCVLWVHDLVMRGTS